MRGQGPEHLPSTATRLSLLVAEQLHEQVQGSRLLENPHQGADAGVGTEHMDGVRDVE